MSERALVAVLVLALPSLVFADAAQDAERVRRAGVRTLAVGATRVHLVEHGDLISFFAENAQADLVLDSFKSEIEGPTYTSLEPLTRPVSMALHRVPIKEVIRRMLDGYNYVLEYRGDRLVHVRVLHMIPGRPYKTPRVSETRNQWLEVESGISEGP